MYRTFLVLFSLICFSHAGWTMNLFRPGIQLVAPCTESFVDVGFVFVANDSLFQFKSVDYTSIHPEFEVGTISQLVDGYALCEKGLLYFDKEQSSWQLVNGLEGQKIFKIDSEDKGVVGHIMTETMVIKLTRGEVIDTLFEVEALDADEQCRYIHDFDVRNKWEDSYIFSVVTIKEGMMHKALYHGENLSLIWEESVALDTEWTGVPEYQERFVFVGLSSKSGEWIFLLNNDKRIEFKPNSEYLYSSSYDSHIEFFSYADAGYDFYENRLLARPFPVLISAGNSAEVCGVVGDYMCPFPKEDWLQTKGKVLINPNQVGYGNMLIAWDSTSIYSYDDPPEPVLHSSKNTNKQFNALVSNKKITINTMSSHGFVSLYNLQGRKLLSQSFTQNGVVTLDVSTLSSGSYMLQIDGDGVSQSRKVMIP